jgi:hypothetical protein
MDDEYHQGFYIAVVLCLIVIAMSAYKVAYTTENFDGTAGANLRMQSTLSGLGQTKGVPVQYFTGSGAMEAPVFWNMGSVEKTNALLQAAAADMAVDVAAGDTTSEGFKSKELQNALNGM